MADERQRYSLGLPLFLQSTESLSWVGSLSVCGIMRVLLVHLNPNPALHSP